MGFSFIRNKVKKNLEFILFDVVFKLILTLSSHLHLTSS